MIGVNTRITIRTSMLLAWMSFCLGTVWAENIQWNSITGGTNLISAGQPMDAGFVFELGVFTDNFVPTMTNLASWDAHWVAAQTVSYSESGSRYNEVFTVQDNDPPFVAGALAWVLGRKVTTTGTEMILFRRPSWTWPSPNPFEPTGPNWNVQGDENIQVVIGTVNPDGSPFLMQSEVVRDFAQWRELNLAGEPLNGPGDDPDGDGVPNMMEFVFDTDPQDAASRVSAIGEVVEDDGEEYLQLAIPRRRTHLVLSTVQVSSDLETWHDGPDFTETRVDEPLQWVVRDRTPVSSVAGKRFMRLKIDLPE